MKPVVTKLFFASLFGSIFAAIIALAPIFWIIIEIDVKPQASVEQAKVSILFGLLSFNYSTLASLAGEVLICGIGLGVSASLTWFESRIDGRPLGGIAALFASLAAVGSLLSLILYTGIYKARIQPEIVNENFIKYLQASYIIFCGILVSYFASILQVRRVKDLGGENG